MSLREGGRYANHRQYDWKLGCVVLMNVEDRTAFGLINQILILYNTDCFILCEKLQQVRDEVCLFPVHVRMVCQRVYQYIKSASRRNDAYTVLNANSL